MSQELIIHFNTPTQFSIRYDDDDTGNLEFVNPIGDSAYQDLRWYLETYSAAYIAEPDEERAERTAQQLPLWGEALFEAVFLQQGRTAQRMLERLQDEDEDKRYVTISAVFPEVLSLPWELLKDPDGVFLFNENPRIAVRRSLKTRGGRKARKVKPKKILRLLFVVSRPFGAGFIDPRLEAQAVLTALAEAKVNQIEVEFLRQATFDSLINRLEDEDLPPVDIVHFDGHGVFDSTGQLAEKGVEMPGMKKATTDVANMGYLLFEDAMGEKALVSANTLGEMLHQQKVSMIVLSACQSATVAGEDALNSVAARLVHAGIPSVLAMTYSVLVTTTRLLFQEFYAQLVKGKHTGEAVENARRYLFRHTERGQRRYGAREFELILQDWFIPALYQNGPDRALLKKAALEPVAAVVWHNFSVGQIENRFFGRATELWELERWLVQGAKRITLAGFGGQGKTTLAIELGLWLRLKSRWFEKVVLVDYKAFQGVDAVSYAVSSLGVVLAESLVDAEAAHQVLAQVPTLIILDNVESLAKVPLAELLTTATQWSQHAIILLTTRQLDGFGHADYPLSGSLVHRHKSLEGLREDEAVNYLQYLMTLPPAPDPNVLTKDEKAKRRYRDYARLLRLVQFHPLSMQSIANLLKTQRLSRLEKRLNKAMAEYPDNPVLASLQISIERLDAEVQELLPLLGVFQGGAMEDVLLDITEIPAEKWGKLRPLLETTGLIQVETLADVPYLQFHPSLTTALQSDNEDLRHHHQHRYYEFSGELYFADSQNSIATRAIVKRELPNLLFAVKGALAEATDYAVDFVYKVNYFLNYFGLRRDLEQLNQQATKLAGEVGSQNWYLSKSGDGEQLYNAGHYTEAANIFTEILTGLDTTASYNRCLTLGRLGRCFREQGQTEQAATNYQQGLETAQQLEQTQSVQYQTGALCSDLVDALTDMGRYADAQAAYEQGLTIATKQNDDRQMGVVNGQLGSLALFQGNLAEAEQRYKTAKAIFQRLHEPSGEAIYWHQLGYVYQTAKQLEAAEHAYRQAANIDEAQGNLADAAQTWNNLALVTENVGKLADAEAWYWKAIEVDKQFGNAKGEARVLSNLAGLLQNQPDRLPESQQLAEKALAIKKTLDPATTTIWTTYNILAQIADTQGNAQEAKKYRRLAREAKANFAGTRYELKQIHSQLILAVARGENVEAALQRYDESWKNLKTAIQQILAGERDVDKLCEPLTYHEAPIITAILEGIERPESLGWFEQD